MGIVRKIKGASRWIEHVVDEEAPRPAPEPESEPPPLPPKPTTGSFARTSVALALFAGLASCGFGGPTSQPPAGPTPTPPASTRPIGADL